MPKDVRGIVATEINDAAMSERKDMATLATTLRGDSSKKGLAFNGVDTSAFRDALRSAGFYREWRAKYGEALWMMLERTTGKMT